MAPGLRLTGLLMRKKLVVLLGVAVVGVVAIAAIAVSLLVNIDSFRPQLARAMTAALGRDVTLGRISLSLLSRSAVVEDLSIADDPAFGPTSFVTARALRVGIAVMPLVRSRQLRVESVRLEKPQVTLRRSPAGTWNFSTLGASSATGSPAPSSDRGLPSSLTFAIDHLRISDGEIVIEDVSKSSAAPRPQRHAYEDVTVDVRDFSLTTPFQFAMSASTPGRGSVKMNGHAWPFSAAGLGSTPFEATLDAAHVDLARGGFVDPAAGLAGIIDATLTIASNGARLTSSGTVRGDKMQIVPGASAATRPVQIAYASDYDAAAHQGAVTRGDIQIGDATARLLGRFNTSGAMPTAHLTLTGRRMPLADLQALLPAIGATLPRGAQFRSGVVDVNVTATGPVDRLVIAGPVAMSDATLAGFDLGSQMKTIASFAGPRGDTGTTIQTLRVTMRVAPDGIRAAEMTCIVPSIGSLEGAGTIAPNGALDFSMVGKLTHATGMAGDVARLASLGHPEDGVPFKITGTTASPVFVPDVRRAAAEAIKKDAAPKAAGFLRSLFGKKKQ
jgi:AsmA protein